MLGNLRHTKHMMRKNGGLGVGQRHALFPCQTPCSLNQAPRMMSLREPQLWLARAWPGTWCSAAFSEVPTIRCLNEARGRGSICGMAQSPEAWGSQASRSPPMNCLAHLNSERFGEKDQDTKFKGNCTWLGATGAVTVARGD